MVSERDMELEERYRDSFAHLLYRPEETISLMQPLSRHTSRPFGGRCSTGQGVETPLLLRTNMAGLPDAWRHGMEAFMRKYVPVQFEGDCLDHSLKH